MRKASSPFSFLFNWILVPNLKIFSNDTFGAPGHKHLVYRHVISLLIIRRRGRLNEEEGPFEIFILILPTYRTACDVFVDLFKVPTSVFLLVDQVSLKRDRLMLHVLASPGEL